VVSGDTGLMHLGTAVGTPVVALFGPTVEAFGFFPWRARATVLQRDLICRPCSAFGGDRCPIDTHACLVEITPAEVADAVRRLPR
jgi:heptosyltransferase-2